VNIVLIIIDTLRRDHVGVYGNQWIQTPKRQGGIAPPEKLAHGTSTR
jgi:hypothetical protein